CVYVGHIRAHFHPEAPAIDTSDFFSSSTSPPVLHSFPTRRSSDLVGAAGPLQPARVLLRLVVDRADLQAAVGQCHRHRRRRQVGDRKSTRLNSSHVKISYAVFCLKKKTSSLPALIAVFCSADVVTL